MTDVKRLDRDYDNVTVGHGNFDNSLVIKVWDSDNVGVRAEVRIPTADLPDFLRDVANHAVIAMRSAATNLAIGHCETCNNRRLVPVKRHGRDWDDRCPECGPRMVDGFTVAPQIGDRRVEADEPMDA